MEGKFKVGDIVTGTKKASSTYSITKEGVILEVVKVWDTAMTVKVKDVNRATYQGTSLKYHIGNTYDVFQEYFQLLKKPEL